MAVYILGAFDQTAPVIKKIINLDNTEKQSVNGISNKKFQVGQCMIKTNSICNKTEYKFHKSEHSFQ